MNGVACICIEKETHILILDKEATGSNRGTNEMPLDANSGMLRVRHACDLAFLIRHTSPFFGSALYFWQSPHSQLHSSPTPAQSPLQTPRSPATANHTQPCRSSDHQLQLLLSAPWDWVSGEGACTTVRVVYESADGCVLCHCCMLG